MRSALRISLGDYINPARVLAYSLTRTELALYTKGYNSPMSPNLHEAIRREHNATVEAVQDAQARAVNVGELLLEVRETMEPFAWIRWLDTKCPIPKSAAHRYLNQARMLRKVA